MSKFKGQFFKRIFFWFNRSMLKDTVFKILWLLFICFFFFCLAVVITAAECRICKHESNSIKIERFQMWQIFGSRSSSKIRTIKPLFPPFFVATRPLCLGALCLCSCLVSLEHWRPIKSRRKRVRQQDAVPPQMLHFYWSFLFSAPPPPQMLHSDWSNQGERGYVSMMLFWGRL